jgi:hypothetical protein
VPVADGPWEGLNRVEFHAKPLAPEMVEAALDEAARTRREPRIVEVEIPARYGTGSELHVIELTAGEDNRCDFQLQSRP